VTGLAPEPFGGHAGGMDDGRHRNGRGWGWALFGLLALIVLVETVVLAVMASLLSVVIAIAVPVVVLVLVVLLVRDVRRHWVHDDGDASWETLSV
jgi:Flp pilus assembly protein TadB